VELDVRHCKEIDIDTLVVLSRDTFSKAFEKDNNPLDFKSYINSAFNRDTLLQQLQNPDSFFYFVYSENRLIGYVKINQLQAQTDLKSEDGMELERIYIKDEFQGQGYGTLLLQILKEKGKQAKKCFLWLGVWEKNVKAIQFYQTHGFSKFGTHPYYIGTDKQTDWLMRCDLTKVED
jgi:ribosomal protein S18 acetylase RimI-like enzyme